ncbi:DUF4336 domain-containing protein [Myxococcota bacterium]|nr:DUF4336 domain-containing protein [Myxococcota bacterium]
MLQPLAPDLWAVPNDVFMPGGVHFPGRMVVIRLRGGDADGGLVLVSPVPIDDGLAAELAALGPVRFVVAPNRFHHLFLVAAAQRYPDAQVLVVPGLAEKKPDLGPSQVLGDQVPAAWKGQLQAVPVDGAPAMSEVVLLHVASRTLVVTDLVFHLHQWKGWQTSLVLWMVGCHKKLAQSRSLRIMTKDRAAAGASARRILALDFDRLVMAHGDVVETGGKEALQGALSHMLAGAPAQVAAAAG